MRAFVTGTLKRLYSAICLALEWVEKILILSLPWVALLAMILLMVALELMLLVKQYDYNSMRAW